MKPVNCAFALLALFIGSSILAELINIAEDDGSQSAYGGSWNSGKNGGSGFGPWTLASGRRIGGRYSGFYIADTKTNQDLHNISKNNKAFGMYANGFGFEQAVAYRAFEKPLQVGDSFSFLMENGQFEKKFDKDDPSPGSIGVILRTSNANDSVADYNKDATFEFGYYQGKSNYQIDDGNDNADSGVAFVDSGIAVTVTLKGTDTYDFEIQTLANKKITKLLNRKLKSSSPIQSMALFNRSGDKNHAFFNQLQVTRESK
jgi:hypothetical protein